MTPEEIQARKGGREDIWIPLLELIIPGIIGLVFYWPLQNPLVADVTWIAGLLLMLNRITGVHQARDALKRVEILMARMANIVDLRQECNVDILGKILDAYLNITEPEFENVKESVLSVALERLNRLRHNKRSDKLATSEYYEWLLPILESVTKGQTIKAVSCMFNAEWDDSPPEQRFIKGNENAAKAGATVERIFIMDSSLVADALQNMAVAKHTRESRVTTKLIGHYVDRSKLEQAEPDLWREVGHGFIVFDSHVALIDDFDEAGHVRGMVTMNEGEIKGLEQVFQRLKVHAKPLSMDLVRKTQQEANR